MGSEMCIRDRGTALTALVRGGLKDPVWNDVARQAIGIFRTAPPDGVAQVTPQGTHYLQYSYDTKLHILNGFIQAINGLFDYAKLTGDQEGWDLFAAGRKRAEYELPRYDTGGWSKYSEYRDSDLHYHDVLRGFLARLCTRLQRAKESDQPFCEYAAKFTMDLSRGPEITFSSPVVAGAVKRARVRFSIDKPGTVTLVVTRGRYTHRATVPVSSGAHSFGFKPPAAGSYACLLYTSDAADE